jgi:NAD(P)-dependent dehydrogenase (short-subunit alcohol dehydrogenase family)
VTLTGAFLMSKFVVPLMSETGGSIVLVASQLGHVAASRSVAYCAAKAGLIHLARLLAVDHADAGIRANSLSPGAARRDRGEHGVPAVRRCILHHRHRPAGRRRLYRSLIYCTALQEFR